MVNRGYVVTENETYYIEPESNNLQERHFVFRQSDSTLPPAKCGTWQSRCYYCLRATMKYCKYYDEC